MSWGRRPARAAARSILSSTRFKFCGGTVDTYCRGEEMATTAIATVHPGRDRADIATQIEEYIRAATKPMLLEDGLPPFALNVDNWELRERGNRLVLHVWSENASLTRRVTGIGARRREGMTLRTEVFGGRAGFVSIYDAARPSARNHDRRSVRLELRE